jgi:hypothetical protein
VSEKITPLYSRAEILADLWMNYRGDEEFEDFIEYNDLGLPLSYALVNKIISEPTETLERMVDETFDLLLAALEISNDDGFESLDDLLGV